MQSSTVAANFVYTVHFSCISLFQGSPLTFLPSVTMNSISPPSLPLFFLFLCSSRTVHDFPKCILFVTVNMVGVLVLRHGKRFGSVFHGPPYRVFHCPPRIQNVMWSAETTNEWKTWRREVVSSSVLSIETRRGLTSSSAFGYSSIRRVRGDDVPSSGRQKVSLC